jgi:hypothetical protein
MRKNGVIMGISPQVEVKPEVLLLGRLPPARAIRAPKSVIRGRNILSRKRLNFSTQAPEKWRRYLPRMLSGAQKKICIAKIIRVSRRPNNPVIGPIFDSGDSCGLAQSIFPVIDPFLGAQIPREICIANPYTKFLNNCEYHAVLSDLENLARSIDTIRE